MMTFDEAMTYINSFDRLGKPVSNLNRISQLLELFQNPQDSLKFIHIAGTNGKGSVAQMCSDILVCSGYRVGLFTSPYIIEYADRIQVNGENIRKDAVCEIVEQIKSVIDKFENIADISQFEISTILAFIYFKNIRCDIVVLEAGIGGILDSTNVIKKNLVSIITSISFDHTKILGDTLRDIAIQKAGIIKKNCPCVLSALNDEAVVDEVKRKCTFMSSDFIVPNFSKVKVFKSDIFGNVFYYNGCEYQTRLSGKHQIINAISVIDAMKFLNLKGFNITYSNVFSGLKNSIIPVRSEIIAKEPYIIIDGAHNPAGMKSIIDIISNIQCKRKIAIVGMTKDKNYQDTLKSLIPLFNDYICVDSFSENSIDSEILVKYFRRHKKNAISVYDLRLAVTEAREMVEYDGLLLICGSLYLASEARKILI